MLRLLPYYGTPARKATNDLDAMFDSFFRTGMERMAEASFKIDVEKTADAYIVTAEVPGLTKEDIDIDVENDLLTISVHKEEESTEEDEKKTYVHKERLSFNSTRQISLEGVDEEAIQANMEDGILTITMPFEEEVSKKKSISID